MLAPWEDGARVIRNKRTFHLLGGRWDGGDASNRCEMENGDREVSGMRQGHGAEWVSGRGLAGLLVRCLDDELMFMCG